MMGGALTWINSRMSIVEELGVRPWVSWQAFEKALKAQFEPLSKEECAREQIPEVGADKECQYLYLPLLGVEE